MTRSTDVSQAAWQTFSIPGGTPEVQLTRLGRDPDGGFDVLVRFPTGWSRPGPGFYDAAEEVLFLAGSFEMSGRTYVAGDHGWFPAGFTRVDSSSPTGALALAWFSQPNQWTDAVSAQAEEVAHEASTSRWTETAAVSSPGGTTGWLLRADERRSSWIVDSVPDGVRAPEGTATVDLFDLATHRWTSVAGDEPLPAVGPGPVWMRLVRPEGA